MFGLLELLLVLAGIAALVGTVVLIARVSGHRPMDYPPPPEVPDPPSARTER